MKNKRLTFILIFIVVVLLIPLIAMPYTNEVNWTLLDFVVAAVLLLGVGLTLDFIMTKVKTSKLRIIFIIILLIAFLLVWTELAVGIFGTPFAGQ